MSGAVAGIAQLILLVALAPAINALVKTVKARLQGRRGPGLAQPYRDVWKLLRKDEVVSEHASVLFRVAPAVYAGCFAAAALLVPILWLPAPLGAGGDALALVGLFALARFALALAGLDTGSAFGGMGSSREVAVAALTEPVLLLGIFAVALRAEGTDLTALSSWVAAHPQSVLSPAHLLAAAALLIAVIAETGRVPVDNPDTHLELTMIHEGMLLEYSGRSLGILVWATLLKQAILFALLIALFAPAGAAAGPLEAVAAFAVWLAKLALLALAAALLESTSAKLRILKVPELLGTATVCAALALVVGTVAQ